MGGYIAVARGEVPKKHWRALGRPLTHSRGYIGMLSWSGTAFEYLMPRLFLPLWRESFDFESLSFAVMMQRAAGEPWGVSESGFYSFDAHGRGPDSSKTFCQKGLTNHGECGINALNR